MELKRRSAAGQPLQAQRKYDLREINSQAFAGDPVEKRTCKGAPNPQSMAPSCIPPQCWQETLTCLVNHS